MIVYINDIKKQTEIDNPPLGGCGYLRFDFFYSLKYDELNILKW